MVLCLLPSQGRAAPQPGKSEAGGQPGTLMLPSSEPSQSRNFSAVGVLDITVSTPMFDRSTEKEGDLSKTMSTFTGSQAWNPISLLLK